MKGVAIDFETASAKRDSACAIGLAWIDNGEIVDTDYRLIRPREMRFDWRNIAVHGIKPEDVENEPEFPAVWEEFSARFEGVAVLAHNASFDMSVLRHVTAAYGLRLPRIDYFCTMLASRRVWPGLMNHKLPTVAQHLGITFQHHHAGEDAIVCGRIALSQARHFAATEIAALSARIGLQMKSL